MVVWHDRVITGLFDTENCHTWYLLPCELKSIDFRCLSVCIPSISSAWENIHATFASWLTGERTADFPPFLIQFENGHRKRATVWTVAQNERYFLWSYARKEVVRKPKTVDITGFFKKFCIATRTTKKPRYLLGFFFAFKFQVHTKVHNVTSGKSPISYAPSSCVMWTCHVLGSMPIPCPLGVLPHSLNRKKIKSWF